MTGYLIAYAASAAVFFAVDLIWLGVVAKDFYRSALGPLLLERPNMAVAGVFYAMYVVGIVVFAVAPALRVQSAINAAMYGALFGFFAYATYELTNLATLKNWPWSIVIVDIVWGAFLTGVSAASGYAAASWSLHW